MVTTGALLHGDVPRHLDFDAAEHPVALQLGGSEPADLAHCARLARALGLRRGQPELRLPQRARAARRLRRLPDGRAALVADCVKAMRDAVDLPVTVKHRIGIDRVESYDFVRDFVGTVAEAGCRCSSCMRATPGCRACRPKENRDIPPLRYEFVHRLKRDFPALTIVLNGGITTDDADRRAAAARRRRDGRPRGLPRALVDGRLGRALLGVPWAHAPATCWACGTAQPGARHWRQVWSDHRLKGRRRCTPGARAGPSVPRREPCRPAPELSPPAQPAAWPGLASNAQTITWNVLGIIGGSGLYDLPGLTDTRWVSVDTPWGAPSDELFTGRLHAGRAAAAGVPAAPRPRPPHPAGDVNYRANIAALKHLGVTDVLSLSAVGGLRADLPPGTFVVVDQFIDRTSRAAKSFFGTGLVAHVSMAHPVCPRLGDHRAAALAVAGRAARARRHLPGDGRAAVQHAGRVAAVPQLELRRDRHDQHARGQARPRGRAVLRSVAMVTDFDCWHPDHDA
jgi:hypothetical protein